MTFTFSSNLLNLAKMYGRESVVISSPTGKGEDRDQAALGEELQVLLEELNEVSVT